MLNDGAGVICIAAQCGGPENCGLADMRIDLNESFARHCRKSRCSSIAEYWLALRIDGKFQKFGKEGIDHIRHNSRQRYIGADIVVPLRVWKGKSLNELRDYLADQARAALVLSLARLREKKIVVDERRLLADVDIALKEFRRIEYDPPVEGARRKKPRRASAEDLRAATEFVARVAEAAPTAEELSIFESAQRAAGYRKKYFLQPRRTPLGLDESNGLLTLLNRWNTQTLKSVAGIELNETPRTTAQGLAIGVAEHQTLVIHPDGELAVHAGVARSVVYRVAASPNQFLEAMAAAALFLSDHAQRRIDRDNVKLYEATAKRCATLAGGRSYLAFFRALFWIEK